MTSSTAQRFIERVNDRSVVIGIVGLGYVGIPLALAALRQGIKVIGFDIDQKRVDDLNAGRSAIKHIPMDLIIESAKTGNFVATTDFDRMAEPDALLIAVPTPLTKYREPDLSYVVKTTEAIAKRLRKDQLIVLESTTYPGTTDEVMRPILEKATGLK
ncbi:MAG: NAD(P)-binding domain-containing protein, partial [Afipia sp.]|nr:NAD(P)-binding domain-containing protein [Afipia sp.]